MRSSKLIDTTFFGKFYSLTYKHHLGDIQDMIFKEDNIGPITMTPKEREL
jgi:hypothetical protein